MPPAAITVTVERSDSTIEVLAEAGQIVLVIGSKSGIGGATVEIGEGRYPEKIFLRLELTGLEELRLEYDNMAVIASVSSRLPQEVRERFLQEGASTNDQPIVLGSPYWMEITKFAVGHPTGTAIPRKSYFEVELPSDLLTRQPEVFSIHWIDFYR